jgi:hypothetical protein
MKQPRIPPIIPDIIQTALSACDGTVFDRREACPSCDGELSGYDRKKKQFAMLVEDDKKRPINVFVKRFFCRTCRAVWFADEPFYPDTRIGSPVVDLCVTLATTMPFTRAAAYLSQMGVIVDRGSVRNYVRRGFLDIPGADMFGIRLPLSIISLFEIAARTGEGSPVTGAEALAACGFPSARRAAPHRPVPEEEGDQRDKEDN